VKLQTCRKVDCLFCHDVVSYCDLYVCLSGIIPEFVGKVDETQYGVEGRTSQLVLRLRAYPDPKVTWYFHNNKLVICILTAR